MSSESPVEVAGGKRKKRYLQRQYKVSKSGPDMNNIYYILLL